MISDKISDDPGENDRASGGGSRRRRSAARLAAVQALYQHAMGNVPTPKLLAEFHAHRLNSGTEPDGYMEGLAEADRLFFDSLVIGVLDRRDELDAAIAERLARNWTVSRLDRLMLQILRCGAFELLARSDVPAAAVVAEYVDVADAFYPRAEVGFVNALLDRMAKSVRGSGTRP
ncbi:MAG: transcription antitermination factor NusB [Sphingomonadaceae bacterium]